MGKESKHGRIVGRVANKNITGFFPFQIDTETFAHHLNGHVQFVVGSVPAVDMDGADLGGGTAGLHHLNDPVNLNF